MKKLLFLAAAFVTGFAAMAQQKADDVAKLSADQYSFGKIKQGVPVTRYFTISYISDKPLVIESAWAGCGCTTPEWSKEPIAPKGTSKLKVGYNAANAAPFTKEVYVKFAGIQEPKVVRITGEVLEPKAYDTYTQSDEFKKDEKARLDQEAKEAKKAEKKGGKA